jgi:hypothetical protein
MAGKEEDGEKGRQRGAEAEEGEEQEHRIRNQHPV